MTYSCKKGFTLMELLVVLGLIGILAVIVIASLNTSRSKGADAATQQALSSARSQAELLFSVEGSYSNVCTDGHVNNGVKSIYEQVLSAGTAQGYTVVNTTLGTGGTANTVTCHADSGGWAAEAPLKGGGMFCIDYQGAGAPVSGNLGPGEITCPAS